MSFSRCLICVGLFVLSLNHVITTEETISNASTVNVTEGHDVILTCNKTSSPESDVFWTKNETNSTFIQHGSNLTFQHVNRTAKGEYLCYSNVSGDVTLMDAIVLNVQYPARILHVSVEPYEMLENGTITFSFGIEGNPDPVWHVGNRDTGVVVVSSTIASPDATIDIPTTCGSSGFWEVRGHNSLNHGVDVFDGHNVTIYCAPRPKQGMAFIVPSDVNTSVILTMDYLANPTPAVSWSAAGHLNDSHYTENTTKDSATLTISPVKIEDFRNYTVSMKNSVGEYTALYTLVPSGRPEAPTGLHYSKVTYQSVRLHWTAGYNMGTYQEFHVMFLKGNNLIQLSTWNAPDNSTDHGRGQQFDVDQIGLDSDVIYTLTIVAVNNLKLTSYPAKPYVSFRTGALPQSPPKSKYLGVTLASVGGALVGVGVLVLIVFTIRHWRKPGYTDLNKVTKEKSPS